MITRIHRAVPVALFALAVGTAQAGPYSLATGDASNSYDAPVPGFVGPDGDGAARLDNGDGTFSNPDNRVNPLFFGWAAKVTDYSPAPGVATQWQNSSLALGPVTGDNAGVVSLGDLSAKQISNGVSPGRITVSFVAPIKNLSGADFVVFENGFASAGGAGVAGQIIADLGYVEVSSNGSDFARFPSRSLTPALVGPYGTIDPTNVFNLAGKHANAYGQSWGTPFDLSQLATDPLVKGGQVDLNAIRYVRIVDIPGNGSFTDSQGSPIYDAWETIGSGGFDLEAIGAISQTTTYAAWAAAHNLPAASENLDTDGDGLPNLLEYAFSRDPTTADNTTPPTEVGLSGGRLKITFQRDERAADLTFEVQASNDLASWATIARSQGGQAVTGGNGFAPEILETSASPIASVGILRKVEVKDVVDLTAKSKRFLRVKVTESP